MEWWLFGLIVFVVAALVTYLLWKYINLRIVPFYVTLLVWIGWFFSFLVPLLIPVDVTSNSHTACQKDATEGVCTEPWIQLNKEVLVYFWQVIYWTTYILCWTAYPLLQSYCTAGDFTVFERARTALKENLIFYTVAGVVVAVFVIWISVINRGINGQGLFAVAIAAANAWGLFMLICLLGYGLVEAPKTLWRTANLKMTLKWHQFHAASLRDGYEKAKKELDYTLKLIKKYSDRVSRTDPFRPYIDIITEKCPAQYKELMHGEGDVDLTYQKLVDLHVRVMRAEHEAIRSRVLYEITLNAAFELEDVLRSVSAPVKAVKWSFRPRRTGQLAAQLDFLEWIWKVYMEKRALQLAAGLCGALSLVIIWSEVVFNIPFDLSIFSLLVGLDLPFTVQWLFVFVPVFYMAYCAYWSLFRLRIFNFYRLIPHHQTDANSILFSAAYLCRLAAPLGYNFLLMIHNENTAFKEVLGSMNLAPFLGVTYNFYFPIILVLLCLANLFNLYTKFVVNCCFARFSRRFVFDEDFSDTLIDRGREIIAHERELREKGMGILADKDYKTRPKQSPDTPRSQRLPHHQRQPSKDKNDSPSASPAPSPQQQTGFPPFWKIFGKQQDTGRVGLLENDRNPRNSTLYGSSEQLPSNDPFADFNNN